MKNVLMFAMALVCAAPLAVPAPVLALDTSRGYTVKIQGGNAGTWKLRKRVVDTGASCRYTIQWTDLPGPPLSRTVLCKVDEEKASDNFDCQQASLGFFDTAIMKSASTCKGFNTFGQEITVGLLIAGESSTGSIDGIFMSGTMGDVQSFTVN